MKLFKNRYLILFTLLLGAKFAWPFTQEMAHRTAQETWWYFQKVVNAPTPNQQLFAVRLKSGQWLGNVRQKEQFLYQGNLLSEKGGKITEDIISFDSTLVTDWAFKDGFKITGAFTLRIKKSLKKDKRIKDYLSAKFIKSESVGVDFLNRSKRIKTSRSEDSDILDQFGDIFLEKRFIGGREKFYKYLGASIVYPNFAKSIGLYGYCYVSFVVTKEGLVESVNIEQSIGGGTSEVIEAVITNMPKFTNSETDPDTKFVLPVKLVFY